MEFVKKLKPFDYFIILILIIGFIIGCLTFSGLRQTSSKQIDKTTKVEMEIYLRGVAVTSDEPVFKVDDETFITIRNVPYTKLKIDEVQYSKRKAMISSAISKKGYILADDETMPYTFDYIVKISDNAKITKEGDAVVGGNKVKIGLPVTLEGAKYKLNGTISNITIE